MYNAIQRIMANPEDGRYDQFNDPETPKVPDVNPDPVTGYEDPPTQTTPRIAETPQAHAQRIIDQIHSTREPSPKSDAAKADRLQRMGRIASIGKISSVLGDMLTTSMGGRVVRRAPDSVMPTILSQYSSMMDKDKADSDTYSYRAYQKERQDLGMDLGQANADIQRADTQKRYDALQTAAKLKADDLRERQAAIAKQREADVKEKNRHNVAEEGIQGLRVNKPTAGMLKVNQPLTITGTDGKPVSLTPEQANNLYNNGLKNGSMLTDKFKGLVTEQYPTDKRGRLDKTQPAKLHVDKNVKRENIIQEQYNHEQRPSVMTNPQYNSQFNPVSGIPNTAQPKKTNDTFNYDQLNYQ